MQYQEIFITTPHEIIGNSNLEWIFESQIFETKNETKTRILRRFFLGGGSNQTSSVGGVQSGFEGVWIIS